MLLCACRVEPLRTVTLYSTVTTAVKRKQVEGRSEVLANTNVPYARGRILAYRRAVIISKVATNLKLSGRVRCSSVKVGQNPPSVCRKNFWVEGFLFF